MLELAQQFTFYYMSVSWHQGGLVSSSFDDKACLISQSYNCMLSGTVSDLLVQNERSVSFSVLDLNYLLSAISSHPACYKIKLSE